MKMIVFFYRSAADVLPVNSIPLAAVENKANKLSKEYGSLSHDQRINQE